MKTKPLGNTSLMVSELCLGTMTWGKQNTEAEGHAQIDYALDQGINFMDTAEIYAVPPSPDTYGKTETIIGTWLARNRHRRDGIVLATKVHGGGNAWIRNGRRSDGPSIRAAIEGSLRRLQTDYVDLYQIHGPWRGHYHFDGSWSYAPHRQDTADVLDTMRDTLEALGGLVKEGKIRHLGVSNESAWGIGRFLRLADEAGLPRLVSVQNEYNLLRRQFDLDLAELAHHETVGLLAYSPLAAGVLTGKYLDGQMPKGSRGDISNGIWRQNEFSDPATRAYLALAKEHGLDPAQMAIAFCLTRPFMTSVIVGATSLDQLRTDIAARDIALSPEVLAGIEAIHRRYPRPI